MTEVILPVTGSDAPSISRMLWDAGVRKVSVHKHAEHVAVYTQERELVESTLTRKGYIFEGQDAQDFGEWYLRVYEKKRARK